MDLFSSNPEDTINRAVNCVSDVKLISNEEELINIFDLKQCVNFISHGGYSKVCLQFPDSLLQFSVQVALWLENHISQKVFVLGDTTYGSCCVDELAVDHVEADAVIHVGRACLSPTARLPVLYVLPKAQLHVAHFSTAFTKFCNQSEGTILLLYDVAYSHLLDEIKSVVRESPQTDRVVISELCLPIQSVQPCCVKCTVAQGSTQHETTLLGRAYCCPSPGAVIYIADKYPQNLTNFALSLRDVPFFTYTGGEVENIEFNRTLRRRLFLVEKVKDAKTIGILAGTLSVERFLGAIERVKRLAKYRGKKCYIFSVGKPNPAKLANFPEIEVYVLVSCAETCLETSDGGGREFMQPVVTLLEVELALNPNRSWDDKLSVDFRDLLQGGAQHKPFPEGQEPLAADVSLIDNKIRSDLFVADDQSDSQNALSVRENYQISIASSYNAGRSWRGLEQALGETPVTKATMGRSGIPLAYEEEKKHQPS